MDPTGASNKCRESAPRFKGVQMSLRRGRGQQALSYMWNHERRGRETVEYVARAKTTVHAIVGREIYFAGHQDTIPEVYILTLCDHHPLRTFNLRPPPVDVKYFTLQNFKGTRKDFISLNNMLSCPPRSYRKSMAVSFFFFRVPVSVQLYRIQQWDPSIHLSLRLSGDISSPDLMLQSPNSRLTLGQLSADTRTPDQDRRTRVRISL